jgi:hypothetical protein
MVLRVAHCKVPHCTFKVKKNGYYQTKEAMEKHAQEKHPDEYLEMRTTNLKLQRQIRELQDRMVTLWEFEREW